MTHPAPDPDSAPLAGVRVLDLTRLLPGPLAAQHLADLGAEVIKIEDTGAGDYAAPAVRALVNRGKRAIRIDLKQPAGRGVLLRLARDADVLVEGFRPGVMQRLAVGYDTLAAANPRLVYCSISGFGQRGPLAHSPGHDINYTALTGVADQIGNAHGPALSNLPVADLLGGTMGAVRDILAALFAAARSGRGRHVDVSIAGVLMAHAVVPLAALRDQGRVPGLGEGRLTGAVACYGFYATADGRHVAVGALEPKFWQVLCRQLQRPDLAPLHHTGDAAVEQRVRAELAAIFAAHPLAHWTALFADGEACVTPVLRLDEAMAHPHFRGHGPAEGAAPAPGEHTRALLRESGYADSDIAALRAAGAVA